MLVNPGTTISHCQIVELLGEGGMGVVVKFVSPFLGRYLYIAMALHEGESLEDRIKRGPIPPAEAVSLIAQAASGLARAHEAGVIHRDVKPAYILVSYPWSGRC